MRVWNAIVTPILDRSIKQKLRWVVYANIRKITLLQPTWITSTSVLSHFGPFWRTNVNKDWMNYIHRLQQAVRRRPRGQRHQSLCADSARSEGAPINSSLLSFCTYISIIAKLTFSTFVNRTVFLCPFIHVTVILLFVAECLQTTTINVNDRVTHLKTSAYNASVKLEVRSQTQIMIKDPSNLGKNRTGCVTSVLSSEVTKDRKDRTECPDRS